ncbi:hypothetical protein BJ508DRAFT_332391, partial [Ascobolus immersus RN42]
GRRGDERGDKRRPGGRQRDRGDEKGENSVVDSGVTHDSRRRQGSLPPPGETSEKATGTGNGISSAKGPQKRPAPVDSDMPPPAAPGRPIRKAPSKRPRIDPPGKGSLSRVESQELPGLVVDDPAPVATDRAPGFTPVNQPINGARVPPVTRSQAATNNGFCPPASQVAPTQMAPPPPPIEKTGNRPPVKAAANTTTSVPCVSSVREPQDPLRHPPHGQPPPAVLVDGYADDEEYPPLDVVLRALGFPTDKRKWGSIGRAKEQAIKDHLEKGDPTGQFFHDFDWAGFAWLATRHLKEPKPRRRPAQPPAPPPPTQEDMLRLSASRSQSAQPQPPPQHPQPPHPPHGPPNAQSQAQLRPATSSFKGTTPPVPSSSSIGSVIICEGHL